ncbi:Beta-catenin-like protein 1 [Sciurus carolinensis]|uniref:Beta-catenin-like protein 1 n=2 Tax=Boreoeutheria TaxID=1437010 RepID=A0AA41MHY6_SCICA|nr:Beta-catenin-like protein 1 [Sciurus carolinensis]
MGVRNQATGWGAVPDAACREHIQMGRKAHLRPGLSDKDTLGVCVCVCHEAQGTRSLRELDRKGQFRLGSVSCTWKFLDAHTPIQELAFEGNDDVSPSEEPEKSEGNSTGQEKMRASPGRWQLVVLESDESKQGEKTAESSRKSGGYKLFCDMHTNINILWLKQLLSGPRFGCEWREPKYPALTGPGTMDVGELLSYQPNRGTKRPRDDEEEELKTRRKQAGPRERGRHREEEAAVVEEADDDKKRLLQIIDREGEEEEEEEEPLDESSVKKMILTFEKRSYKNQELRIKFPDNPEKFMESELDLNDIIQEMHVVATMPDLYHLLVELNAVQSLLGLLGHDNTDILSDLSSELTDIDTLHESEEGAEVLIDALVDGQVVALLVQNLERLDESVREEADGVHNTLAIVENMAEFRPEMCTEAAQQGLLQWLLKRLKAKMPFDANKLYCSEVLAILLQDNDENRELLGELDGIDVLLQQLSVFKRHNPSTAEEQEMMENLFDSLCSCLMLSSNRERFLKGEGLQLMNLMLREKKISRSSALKVLDHAMIGPEGTDNCHKFVDILGLRTIFPLFMKSPRKIKKVGTTEKEHEEHVCSILASLLRNLRGQQRTRLLNKFTENDSEKVDRLMELHFKYLGAMQVADKKIEGEKHAGSHYVCLRGALFLGSPQMIKARRKLLEHQTRETKDIVRRGEIIDNDVEDEFYLRRLDAGLFVLQHICYIMAEICSANVPQIRQRVHQILNMRGSSIKIVRHIIKEYAENIGDGRSPEFRENEQKRIVGLLENF